MDTIKLKNGTRAPAFLVGRTMIQLKEVMKDAENPFAFIELVSLCRDRDHQMWGNTLEVLKSLALVDPGGSVHDLTRNIVLSATEGEGLHLKLVSPVDEARD